MKYFFYKILDVIASFFALIVPINIVDLVKRFFLLVYNHYCSKKMKSAGKDFKIGYPANILGGKYMTFGHNFMSFSGLRIEAYDSHLGHSYTPSIEIGDNVSINFDCHIGCVNSIIIGNNVLLASKIFITDHMHGEITVEALKIPPSLRQVVSKGPVVIKDNVWIGEGVVILPNVTIGENSIIGANSVVSKDVPANAVVAGIPAKIIKILI